MNSEVVKEAKGGHGRYLSLGGGGDDDDVVLEVGEEDERGGGRVKGPREMVGGMGTPGSLYDGEGFLRDGGRV